MEEKYCESGSSPPSDSKSTTYGDYRQKLIDKMLPNTPSTLYSVVKKPKKYKDYDEEPNIFELPICSKSLPHAKIPNLRSDLVYADKIVYFRESKLGKLTEKPQFDFDETLHNVTENIETMMRSQPACKVGELDRAISSKSTVVYFPVEMKLTDKHLAEMPVDTSSTEDIIWPHRWQFDENMGSFLCVVNRIDKNNYEFKVLMIPGTYTDDPVTLAMLMKLFNPLYQTSGECRGAALKKAKMMVASAANEFFGPQIVESCIAVWLSCRRNLHVTIKKSNMILKMNNVKLTRPVKKSPQVVPSASEGSEGSGRSRTASNRPRCLATTTQCAHFLTAIFGYNRAMYPDLRSLAPPQTRNPMYDFIREIHVNEGQRQQLLAGTNSLKSVNAENRRKA